MKRILKLMAVIMALALTMTTTAITALAAPTAATGTTTQFNKYLVVDSDATVPELTFDFTIAPGTAVSGDSTKYEIFAGIGQPTVSQASFDSSSTTTAGTPSNDSDTTKKYATDAVTVDFTGITFPAAGVYRYVINETNGGATGVSYDSGARYLDVIVKSDDSNVLSVGSYVLRNVASDIDLATGRYATDPDTKSDGFTNSVTSYDLEFSKAITGNQADKSKLFTFTLSIEDANPGTYNIETPAGESTITIAADGTYTGTFQLTDGDEVHVYGLPSGSTYSITENAQDYTATIELDGAAADAAEGTMDADHTAAFTNTRNGIIPTGVLITVAPFAVGILVFGAAIIYVVNRRRRTA